MFLFIKLLKLICSTLSKGCAVFVYGLQVQNKVKTQVECMTGLKCVVVNIHVQGVSVPKKKQESSSNVENEKE